MATLPLIQSGRVENVNISRAVLPTVNAPQVEYTGLKAGAQYADTVSQTLDRLSRNLFGIASEAAKQAGMQYVADNPITDEQLQAAKDGDVTALQLGGPMNIFDQAIRKARAFEVSSTFEAEARNELTTMLTKVESGEMKVDAVQTNINSMMAGYSKSISQIDPEASLKFRATIATVGNTVLAKATELQLKREKDQRLIKFDQDFDNSVRLLEASVSQGFWVDPKDGAKRSVEDLIDVYRQTINTSALLLGDAQLQKTYSEKFEKAQAEAKVNAVSAFVTDMKFSANSEVGLAMIQSNNLGKMSDVYANMPYDSKAKVLANYMITMNQRADADKARKAAEKRADEIELYGLYSQAISMSETDPQRKGLVSKIAALGVKNPDAVPLSILKDLQEPSKEGNAMVEFNALSQIYSGAITSSDQLQKIAGLTGKQYISLLKTLHSENKADDSRLNREVSRLAGIPTIPGQVVIVDPKGTAFRQRNILMAKVEEIRAKAAIEGKVVTTEDIVSQLETYVDKQRNSESAKAARKTLETYAKKDWINGPITRDSLPALELKAKDNKIRDNELRRIRQLLDQAEGVNQ